MTPSWWRWACAVPQSTLAGRPATPGLDSGAHSEHAVERGTGRTGCVATSARVGRGPGPTDSRRTSPTLWRVATETRPKPSGPVSDPPATGRPSPAPFLTGELRRAIANGSRLLARKGLGRGPGSCDGALKLVPDCLDARVTGHPQAHLGNSAAGGGSCTGDGALKPSPYRGDLIASRLPAPTLNNLAHHRAGAGEPLVLLHGVGESAVGWQPVLQALSDDYDVIAFDLPGFGHSPALPPGVTPTAAALADAIERRTRPAWRGPVPRRRVLPGRPGRPRARHPGPHPFGHRDRP